MKRRALIIGCAGSGQSYLPGVKKDVANYTNFLMSNCGGAWLGSEIISLIDQPKESIKAVINQVRVERNDFTFIVFSGHGNFSAPYNCRRLYTDDSNFIYETELQDLSTKQLLIIDSCAGIEYELQETVKKAMLFESRELSSSDYRLQYEQAISDCPEQQINLYSCSVEESSADTAKGGMYTKNLLTVARRNTTDDVLSSLTAQERAEVLVVAESKGKQHPDYYCSARRGNKLPLSLIES